MDAGYTSRTSSWCISIEIYYFLLDGLLIVINDHLAEINGGQ